MDCLPLLAARTAAISQIDALLPSESALLAILLEQARDIAILRQKLEMLDGSRRLMD
jgi:hypothetical protein